MAHDNYDSFYTWNGGTLVLDTGVFAYDEPNLRMCNRTPVQATAFDRIVDPLEQRYCAKPMEMMSPKHAPIPIETAARCDTIIPGRSYCCPPYVMPNDWRVDYQALGEVDMSEEAPIVEGGPDTAFEDVGVIVQKVEAAAEEAKPRVVTHVQEKPMLSIGIALMAGIVLGKLMSR